ncbi:MAG: redoxin domain-containing protein [Candidatus Desulfofervidus sp.]|nr:redoxin domain-containing protein [Candidatus Desulfofervidus sp.]
MATCLGKKQVKKKVESQMMQETDFLRAVLGKEAPDFEAEAFYNDGFVNIKLSNYRGKWVVLCFYPADFTFV